MDKQKIIRKMKAGVLNRKFSTFNFQFSIIALLFLVVACGRSRRLGVSDQELFAQQEMVDTLQQALMDFDAEMYMVPSGIKYTESRAVDPANPPVVFDIANRNLTIKKFDLSDYYTQVRYVKLKHPKAETGINFLIDVNPWMYFEAHQMEFGLSLGGINSRFIFTNDYIIAGDICYGIHCFDKEGTFLYTIESNEFPKEYDVSKNTMSFAISDLKGFYGRISTIGNNCLYCIKEDNKSSVCLYDLTQEKPIITRPMEGSVYQSPVALIVDNMSMAGYAYSITDTVTGNFLFTFDLKGDTLCRFPNYNTLPELNTANRSSSPLPDIYYFRDMLTVRQTMNDTVFRVVAPNRLVPAYVLHFGSNRSDVQTYLYGNLSEKLLPIIWKESDRYVLFVYTQNRNTQINRNEGSVKFFYSFYDKQNRQLYHFNEGTNIPDDEYFIENHIPDAMPFLLSHADIENNQLRVCYSKKRLETLLKNKGFASLSPEQQQKLQELHTGLEDNEILIMILE